MQRPIQRVRCDTLKGPKKNDDKSAVAMLKKNDSHENVWQTCCQPLQKSR